MSRVESHERKAAKRYIEQALGFEPPQPQGPFVCIKIWGKESEVHQLKDHRGEKKLVYLPPRLAVNDKHPYQLGLVVSQGPLCASDDYAVGDFVMLKKGYGTEIMIRDVTLLFINKADLLGVISDPRVVAEEDLPRSSSLTVQLNSERRAACF